MRAVVIVVVAPCRNQMAGMAQRREQVLVQAFVPQATIEALHEAVLHRLSRCDVVPFNLPILLPFEHGVRRQLGAVVTDDHAGGATRLRDPVQLAGNADAGDRSIDDGGQALPAEVVDHAEDTEPAAINQSIRHEVQAPALVRPLRDRHWRLVPIARLRPPRLRTVNPSSR